MAPRQVDSEIKIFLLPVTRFGLPEVFLCCQWIAIVLLHRCQNAQIALYSAVIIVVDIILNHLDKLSTVCELSAVIRGALENAPEAFHLTIVNALVYSGHACEVPGQFSVQGNLILLFIRFRVGASAILPCPFLKSIYWRNRLGSSRSQTVSLDGLSY